MKFHEVASIFPLIEGEEFQRLVDDIRANGLVEPIWVHPDGSIIDGRNRYRACVKTGVEPHTRQWNGSGSLILFVLSLNLHRRHLNPSQRACLATEILPMLEAEAKARQATRATSDYGKNHLVAKIPQGEQSEDEPLPPAPALKPSTQEPTAKADDKPTAPIEPPKPADTKSRDIAAKQMNVAPRYVSDAKKLKAEEPAKYAEVRAGTKTLQDAKAEIKQERKAAIVESIIAEPPKPPQGPFRVIVVDPPWKYESRAEDPTHRGRTPYPDMELADIKALPIPALAHTDCILWLWTTNAFMREAFECLDAWGFQNKTILTWTKSNLGLGNWLRGKTEHCLMAVRGKPIVTLTNQTTHLVGPLREHSRKPDEFFAMVDSLCPGNKLEMFSRQKRDGWQSTGAEENHFASE